MDIILDSVFEKDRWTRALAKGFDKGIRKDQLYQMTKPEFRAFLHDAILEDNYRISPPHTARIPKDTPGEYRTVYVNEPLDRVFLSIVNDLLFDLCPDMIHPQCKSYLSGVGCGNIVKHLSRTVCDTDGEVIGWKSDLSKYFDSVPIRYIDRAFDEVEARCGHSSVIDVLREYYHSDLYLDEQRRERHAYQSLKQGCAVAAFLADVIIRHIDERLSDLDGYYVRYSDDMVFIGKDYRRAMDILTEELAKMNMSLNPKKVEYLSRDRWFKFLGYSIKGQDISLSNSRIKTFQEEILARTVKRYRNGYANAVRSVNRYLYRGDGRFSWATQIFGTCNVPEDIATLNEFVMDCLRAVKTRSRHIGGLGYVTTQKTGCISRGRGKDVTPNRKATDPALDGYLTIPCMKKAMETSRELYHTLTLAL